MHLLEKDADCGLHASGRNSGVLHAGFYYSPDSLKAHFTWRGNRLLTEYCEEKKIPLNKCGKLVVARTREDHAGLDELFRRGRANGIPLKGVQLHCGVRYLGSSKGQVKTTHGTYDVGYVVT